MKNRIFDLQCEVYKQRQIKRKRQREQQYVSVYERDEEKVSEKLRTDENNLLHDTIEHHL